MVTVKSRALAALADVKAGAPSTGANLAGMPGDSLSPSRFVRAAVFTALTPQQATSEDAIWAGFQILDSFDIPVGAVPEPAGSNPPFEITEWAVTADMSTMKSCAWTDGNRDIRMIGISRLATDGTEMLTFKLDQERQITELGGQGRFDHTASGTAGPGVRPGPARVRRLVAVRLVSSGGGVGLPRQPRQAPEPRRMGP